MSLPPIPRNTGLPSRPAATDNELNTMPGAERSTPEVLVITVDDDSYDPEALTVTFEGAGFDISNDEIILDILRMAAYSYGYDVVKQPR